MHQRLFIILTIASWWFISACYKDKGNYTYQDINKVGAAVGKDTFTVFQFDTLDITAQITQTLPDPAGLTYKWVMYPGSQLTRRTLDSTSAHLHTMIPEAPGTYTLHLFITDNKTGVTNINKMTVKVLSAFNEGWLVLEDGSTQADLSMITPVNTVFHRIYSKSNPERPLPTGANMVDVTMRRSDQVIYVLSPAGGIQVDYTSFRVTTSFNDWFFAPPAVIKPELHIGYSGGEVIINNGRPYSFATMVPPPFKFGPAPVGSYYLAPFLMSSDIRGPIYYDTIAQGFRYPDPWTFDLYPLEGANEFFTMKKVSKRLIQAAPGQGAQIACLFKNNNNDSLFVYTFQSEGEYSEPTGASPVKTAPGLGSTRVFCPSKMLPHIYYASDNKLYLYDIPAQSARLAYTFPAGTEVRKMKVFPLTNRVLVVATHEAGKGKVYYFPVGATGDFENNTYSKVFEGFDKINDIAYKTGR
ncbi:MAG TPA: PKD-like family lipoprotein [Chitinophaga sp.]|uniref:PKD-like family lipoprotein n=1 Tax=Chitinophaga sp. TaxID=1869181 RepID=UPI002C21BF8E|nr:PKD-like family lipoprotein [Chitinophaga sp.]HVI48531.1 PKD-like family lipoprotein [Chitinophaga sp.]